jgi:CDP-diacylglycerol--serine O-phosphatidyltransferase
MSDRMKKGIYILPSLLTCGSISSGYLSIISSLDGEFSKAAWFIVLAVAFDMTDGRVARLTRTTSEFGVQLDSLADLISFGLAPSIMMYQLVLSTMGKLGIAVAILFVLCSALRLAKFNVNARGGIVHSSFMGLPTPASAGLLVSFVLSYELLNLGQSLSFKTIPILMKSMPLFFKIMPVVIVVLSLLMVSNIPYYSFKNMKLSRPKTFRLFVLVVLLLFLIITFPQNIIFVLFSLYIVSGLIGIGVRYYNAHKKKNIGVGNGD